MVNGQNRIEVPKIEDQIPLVEVMKWYGVDIEHLIRPLKPGYYEMICCPFSDHYDHTPSFAVYKDNDSHQHFYCYGCQRGNDSIEFVRQMEPTLSFLEVVDKVRIKSDRLAIKLSSKDNVSVSLQLFYQLGQEIKRISPKNGEYRYEMLDAALLQDRISLAWRSIEGINAQENS